MTEKQLCRRTGLDSETVLRLHQLGLVPAWVSLDRPQRGRWRIFGSEAVVLGSIGALFLTLGARNAAECAGIIARLLSLPQAEHEAFLEAAAVAKYPGGRIEWAADASQLPRTEHIEPNAVVRLADAIHVVATGPPGR